MNIDKFKDIMVVIAIAICGFLFVMLGVYIAKGNDNAKENIPCVSEIEVKKYG